VGMKGGFESDEDRGGRLEDKGEGDEESPFPGERGEADCLDLL
jgi:hypothetical protein